MQQNDLKFEESLGTGTASDLKVGAVLTVEWACCVNSNWLDIGDWTVGCWLCVNISWLNVYVWMYVYEYMLFECMCMNVSWLNVYVWMYVGWMHVYECMLVGYMLVECMCMNVCWLLVVLEFLFSKLGSRVWPCRSGCPWTRRHPSSASWMLTIPLSLASGILTGNTHPSPLSSANFFLFLVLFWLHSVVVWFRNALHGLRYLNICFPASGTGGGCHLAEGQKALWVKFVTSPLCQLSFSALYMWLNTWSLLLLLFLPPLMDSYASGTLSENRFLIVYIALTVCGQGRRKGRNRSRPFAFLECMSLRTSLCSYES